MDLAGLVLVKTQEGQARTVAEKASKLKRDDKIEVNGEAYYIRRRVHWAAVVKAGEYYVIAPVRAKDDEKDLPYWLAQIQAIGGISAMPPLSSSPWASSTKRAFHDRWDTTGYLGRLPAVHQTRGELCASPQRAARPACYRT